MDSVEIFENSEVILAKFSSHCVFMLSLSYSLLCSDSVEWGSEFDV